MLKRLIWLLAPLYLVACVTTPAPVRDGPASAGGLGDGVSEQVNLPTAPPPAGVFIPDETIKICNGLRVRNAPANDHTSAVIEYDRLAVALDRIVFAPVPLNGGCISSGYGQRDGRLHKGLDISAPRGTWVYAAAPGIVLEAGWGGGYGNYVLINHGLGVITRYAHLDTFVEGMEVGVELGFGWPIGQVGNTSTQSVGVHLHFEVLTGNYDNPKKSFGLSGNDPLGFPVYITPPVSVPQS